MTRKQFILGRRMVQWVAASADFSQVHDDESFRRIIERERSRSDRNSHTFSLAVFDLDGKSPNSDFVRRLTGTLQVRSRITDDVGWLGEDGLAVILPDTYGDGARKFADYIRCAMAADGHPVSCRVYSYTGGAQKPEDNKDQLCFDGILDQATDVDTMPVKPLDAAAENGDLFAEIARLDDRRTLGGPPPESYADIHDVIGRPFPLWKRVLDIVGAVIAIVVLLPLFAVTALLIKLVSPGPALFCQERVGFMGRRFKCLKFRTMHVHADQKTHQAHFGSLMKSDTPMVKLDARKDQRIIPFGRLLRATAIDELPQIFNVLKGDMSLIGPRPCIPYEYENYSRWQRQRVDTVPGMTGFWQVNGKNRTTFTEMMRMDIRYGRRKSLFLDLGIILKTIPAIWTQVADMVKPRIDKRDPDPA